MKGRSLREHRPRRGTMRIQPSWLRRRTIRLAALMLILSVDGCARTSYTPEIAGVVAAQEHLPDGTFRITLRDGRSQTVDTHAQQIVIGSGLPNEGELFLAGSKPTSWVGRLSVQPYAGVDSCYWVGGAGTEEAGFITTDAGLRLPEAAGFDRRYYRDNEHRFEGGRFCVNDSGEVTAIR